MTVMMAWFEEKKGSSDASPLLSSPPPKRFEAVTVAFVARNASSRTTNTPPARKLVANNPPLGERVPTKAAELGEEAYRKHILQTRHGADCMTCDRPDGFGAQYQCKMAALAVARSLGRPYYHIPLNRSVYRMKFMSDDGAAALEDAMGFARRQLERPLGLACYKSVHNLETSRIPDRDPSFYCKVMPMPNP